MFYVMVIAMVYYMYYVLRYDNCYVILAVFRYMLWQLLCYISSVVFYVMAIVMLY